MQVLCLVFFGEGQIRINEILILIDMNRVAKSNFCVISSASQMFSMTNLIIISTFLTYIVYREIDIEGYCFYVWKYIRAYLDRTEVLSKLCT